jgi:formate-dependent nitrite reductase membrane component NrfD
MKKFFYKLFKDNNDINEKAIIGFGAFIMLVLTLIIDLITGLMGRELPIEEFVFNGFLIMTLGSFGIASVDKFLNKTKKDEDDHQDEAG